MLIKNKKANLGERTVEFKYSCKCYIVVNLVLQDKLK